MILTCCCWLTPPKYTKLFPRFSWSPEAWVNFLKAICTAETDAGSPLENEEVICETQMGDA